MFRSKPNQFSTISELTAAEARKVNGGATRSLQMSFAAPTTRQSEEIEFKGSTVLSGGGTYDHDEGVCIQD